MLGTLCAAACDARKALVRTAWNNPPLAAVDLATMPYRHPERVRLRRPRTIWHAETEGVTLRPAMAAGRKIMRLFARIARRVADYFPVTPLGLFVGLGAAAALKYLAYPMLDLVWLVTGYAVLGLVAAAIVLVTFGALWVKIATRRSRFDGEDKAARTIETGRLLPTGFSSPALLVLPLVQIDWTWEEPERAEVAIARKRFRLLEDVRLPQRGIVKGVRRRIVIQDAFGLARLAIRQRDPIELKVLPHAGRLGEAPLLVSFSGGDARPHPMGVEDGDRVELRRYAPGDPARFIHWKVFGRTRRLMVRMPERALSPARRTVAYQVAGASDDASAAAARVAIESGAFGPEFRFSADGAPSDTARTDEALEMIVRSASARDEGGKGLTSFLRKVEQSGPASLVLFVPPRPGPWLAHVVKEVKARAVRTRVVVATDGIDPAPPPTLWRRLLTLPAVREGTPAVELEQVIAAMTALRVEVVALDRRTGRRLGDRQRAALRRAEKIEAAA
jgi:uncharacterized protein (DUF58 family)